MQPFGQYAPQGYQEMRVVSGVFELLLPEGTPPPVVALPFLVETHPKVFEKYPGKPKLLVPEDLGGYGGIENVVNPEFEVASQTGDIIGRGMKYLFYARIREDFSKFLEIIQGEGIYNVIFFFR